MPDPLLDKKNRPDYHCAACDRVLPFVKVVQDLSGGTPAMRAAGEAYLFKNKMETPDDYKNRLGRTVLFEAYKTTVEALVGAVYKQEIDIGEDVPTAIRGVKDQTEGYIEDIDLAGNHLDVFGKKVFKDQFEGCAVILVEMPPKLESSALTLSATPTALDDRVLNRRPYWVEYSASQAINWQKARINGAEQFTLITFEECSMEPDGEYGEKEVKRYRTFRRPLIDDGRDGAGRQTRPASYGSPQWELNRLIPDAKPGEPQFVLEGSGTVTNKDGNPLSRIPAYESGNLGSNPPLLGLGYLNISHWQNSSDQENILHVVRCPQAIRIGFQPEKPADGKDGAVVGVTGIWDFPVGGDAHYMEIRGDGATKAGRDNIVDIEQRMGMIGLSTLTQRSDSNITATEKKIDNAEKHSMLSTMARSHKDCIEGALGATAEYMGLPSGGSIKLGVSEDQLILTPKHMDVLLSATLQNKLPLRAWLQAALSLLENAGVLAEDVNVEDWVAQIEAMNETQQAVGLATSAKSNLLSLPPAMRGMGGAQSGNGAAR